MDTDEAEDKLDDSEGMKFELNEKGLPLLPEIPKDSKPMRPIFRSYIAWYYRRFTNNPRARVPWKTLNQEFNEYLDSDCFPPYFVIEDPSRMLKKDFLACFAVWQKILHDGAEEPIRFLKALDEHMIDPTLSRPTVHPATPVSDEEDEMNYLSSPPSNPPKQRKAQDVKQASAKENREKCKGRSSVKGKQHRTSRKTEDTSEETSVRHLAAWVTINLSHS